MNKTYIKSSKFYKMMQDAGCVDERLNRWELDILYLKSSHNKQNMEFEQFLFLLALISKLIYDDMDFDQLWTFLQNKMMPLYETIS